MKYCGGKPWKTGVYVDANRHKPSAQTPFTDQVHLDDTDPAGQCVAAPPLNLFRNSLGMAKSFSICGYNMSQIKSWFRKIGRAHLWIQLGSAVGMRALSLVWNKVRVVLCVKENQHRARDVLSKSCAVALISVKATARPPWQADWRSHASTLSPLWVFWLRAIFKVVHSLQRKKKSHILYIHIFDIPVNIYRELARINSVILKEVFGGERRV